VPLGAGPLEWELEKASKGFSTSRSINTGHGHPAPGAQPACLRGFLSSRRVPLLTPFKKKKKKRSAPTYSHTKNLGDTLRVAVLFGSAAMVMAAAAVVVGCAAVVKAPEGSACAAVMSGWAGWW
jgi:hypothetical protein